MHREGKKRTEKADTAKREDRRKGKAWPGKGRRTKQSARRSEKERECKKDVAQYVGYREARARANDRFYRSRSHDRSRNFRPKSFSRRARTTLRGFHYWRTLKATDEPENLLSRRHRRIAVWYTVCGLPIWQVYITLRRYFILRIYTYIRAYLRFLSYYFINVRYFY